MPCLFPYVEHPMGSSRVVHAPDWETISGVREFLLLEHANDRYGKVFDFGIESQAFLGTGFELAVVDVGVAWVPALVVETNHRCIGSERFTVPFSDTDTVTCRGAYSVPRSTLTSAWPRGSSTENDPSA